MAAPQKPWEGQSLMQPIVLNSNSGVSGLSMPQQVRIVTQQAASVPPPLPSRSSAMGGATSSSMMHSRYLSPHSYPMGSFMGGYTPGFSSYSDFGMDRRFDRRFDDLEYRFIQMAEESSAPAFQSIEAFVRSFSSVTMMLESTYQAMYMSFRAVLSVAENVARLRGLFRQFFTSLAALKTVAWFYNKIRYLLGLVSESKLSEDAWKAAVGTGKAEGTPGLAVAASRTVWPIVAFFGLLIGGPYLIFKYIGITPPDPALEWKPLENGESQCCVAIHEFTAPHEGELGFRRGDRILIPAATEKQTRRGGWILAARPTTGEKGFVPGNRISSVQRNANLVRNMGNMNNPLLYVDQRGGLIPGAGAGGGGASMTQRTPSVPTVSPFVSSSSAPGVAPISSNTTSSSVHPMSNTDTPSSTPNQPTD